MATQPIIEESNPDELVGKFATGTGAVTQAAKVLIAEETPVAPAFEAGP
jgi:hypothetical protein